MGSGWRRTQQPGLNPKRRLQHPHLAQDRIGLGLGGGVEVHAAVEVEDAVVEFLGADRVFDQGDRQVAVAGVGFDAALGQAATCIRRVVSLMLSAA